MKTKNKIITIAVSLLIIVVLYLLFHHQSAIIPPSEPSVIEKKWVAPDVPEQHYKIDVKG